MNCTYGCPQEDIDSLCANCNDSKRSHSTVHPHICTGKMQPNSQSPSHSCNCPGFVSKQESMEVIKTQLAHSLSVCKELEKTNASLQKALDSRGRDHIDIG